ncbi:NAD(P)-binding protein [Methylobacterium sp. J-088]|uniref:NAD(P)/FAD-dependent oxidoreductase n=1 Tax=Methylobacterium sp. J-088 TaxID=2836664 RepID=UPI001FB87ECB|nr:NAD(P)-binding protein [Methylobacterium sp. J-088]MCJ2063934.1 NAD(P)-binding protein [Methylobacterium sp. J-088]
MSDRRSVAILGAGMAGAAAACRLAEAGLSVQVFDKGRAIGGRMATRRHGSLQFDHGAQFMRAHGPAFEAQLEDWERRGIAAPWAGGGRHVGVPDMTAPVRDLLAGIPVASETTVARIRRSGTTWQVEAAADAIHGPFDAVAITFPAPQVKGLLDASGYALPGVERAAYAPCWSLMVAAEGAMIEALIEPRADPIGLIAADGSKPNRAIGDRLTIHATADWSRDHLEEPKEAIIATLLQAAERHLGTALRPTYVEAHRWRYAQVERRLGMRNLYDPVLRLGAAGDWCLGARIEAAYDSGSALAGAILADLGAGA